MREDKADLSHVRFLLLFWQPGKTCHEAATQHMHGRVSAPAKAR